MHYGSSETILSSPTPSNTFAEFVPKSSFPWVWFGFLFVVAFFVLETLMVVLELNEAPVTAGLTLIAFLGAVYWLFCVYGIHKILAELTRKQYRIGPGEVVLMHFIPLWNIYWLFHWPAELSRYINQRGKVRMVSGHLIGSLFVVSLLLRYLIDGGVGLGVLFFVTMYISSKLDQHVRHLKAMLPENLPPLPDPTMFR